MPRNKTYLLLYSIPRTKKKLTYFFLLGVIPGISGNGEFQEEIVWPIKRASSVKLVQN